MLRSGTGPLTPLEHEAIRRSEAALTEVLEEVNAALVGPVSDLAAALAQAELSPSLDLRPLVWGGRNQP
jgi:hypothetical protein